MIRDYTVHTAKELREALVEIKTFVPEERDDLGDIIYYIYQFFTRLAWLGRAIDRFDNRYSPTKEVKNDKETSGTKD